MCRLSLRRNRKDVGRVHAELAAIMEGFLLRVRTRALAARNPAGPDRQIAHGFPLASEPIRRLASEQIRPRGLH